MTQLIACKGAMSVEMIFSMEQKQTHQILPAVVTLQMGADLLFPSSYEPKLSPFMRWRTDIYDHQSAVGLGT
jgi:hypothetical protein